ncbi:3-hydroxyacyl-CoA dehydrogenase family protein [Youngiibacter fragilis]|uniref:3-hydroxybutyryl-CoA dehydrogenase n=1 Tax=Youngiibacter fragilis 232.1 TaxID=994573 RepID=V7I7Y0_9CLOT|nr:3-hydroxyacyl-CoA dehydrogenase family protein [Youngiibacter fragilis]ETA81354.1 3-hydroxybutyryl-CoA dehydrogenase [Youngiibacter fragilis 232.1]
MEVKKIGVAGSGTMGSSLAETFAKFGYEVYLYDIADAQLERAKKLITLNHETEVKEGMLTPENADALLKRISYGSDIQGFKDVDFLIEAILEKIEVKHSFWGEVSKIVPDHAVLCSNTSGLSITRIAEAVNLPERFGGMHWINPPHIIPLVEVISGDKTSEDAAEVIYQLAVKCKKKPVKVHDAPGFVLNRIQFAIMREALNIVQEGITTVDGADDVMKYGLGLRYAVFGPFEVADLGGLDIFRNISSYLFADLSNADKEFGLLKEHFEAGELGVKSKKGFYDYSDGKDMEQIRYRDEMYTKLHKLLYSEE